MGCELAQVELATPPLDDAISLGVWVEFIFFVSSFQPAVSGNMPKTARRSAKLKEFVVIEVDRRSGEESFYLRALVAAVSIEAVSVSEPLPVVVGVTSFIGDRPEEQFQSGAGMQSCAEQRQTSKHSKQIGQRSLRLTST